MLPGCNARQRSTVSMRVSRDAQFEIEIGIEFWAEFRHDKTAGLLASCIIIKIIQLAGK